MTNSNYTELNQLYENYKDQGMFPSCFKVHSYLFVRTGKIRGTKIDGDIIKKSGYETFLYSCSA